MRQDLSRTRPLDRANGRPQTGWMRRAIQSGPTPWWLVGVGSLLACTSPEAQPQGLDRTIQTHVRSIELPTARRSTLEAIAPGIRIQLDDATIEIDDLSLWHTVNSDVLATPGAEGRAPWTHVTGLKLGQEKGSLVSIDEPLIEVATGPWAG